MDKANRFEMRTDPAFLKRLDDWRRAQDPIPSRAQAIRVLCLQGLTKERRCKNETLSEQSQNSA